VDKKNKNIKSENRQRDEKMKKFIRLLKAFVKDYGLTKDDTLKLLKGLMDVYVKIEQRRVQRIADQIAKEVARKVEQWPVWMLCDRAITSQIKTQRKQKT